MYTSPNLGFTVTEEPLKRVLLVLPEEQECLLIESALRKAGIEVSIARHRNDALRLINAENPQVLVADSEIPEIGNILLCRSVRTEMNMPDIGMIALSRLRSGPDIGPFPDSRFDTNLKRPFAMEELLEAITESQSRQMAKKGRRVLTAGNIKMVPEQWLVYVDNDSIKLTEKEYRLLHELMEVRGRVLTREMLLERVWGHRKALNLETRTLDVHMSRLRTKLGSAASNIITVRNVGYRMDLIPKLLSH